MNLKRFEETVLDVTQETSNVEVQEVSNNIDTETISKSIFDNIKQFFTSKEKEEKQNEEQQDNKNVENETDGKVNMTQAELDNYVKNKINENLSEILPKIKKTKTEELEQKELQNILNEKVDKNYHEFIKFEMSKNKEFDLDEYIKNNKQYGIKQSPKITNINGTSNIKANEKDIDYLKFLKQNK